MLYPVLRLALPEYKQRRTLALTCQKYWVGKPKYWKEKVVKGDKCMGDSQLLGARARTVPLSLAAYSSIRHIINYIDTRITTA